MELKELEARISKTEETIAKKQNLLKKYEAKAVKIQNDPYEDAPEDRRDWWRQVDIESVQDDIERTKKAIEVNKLLLAKYREELEKADSYADFLSGRIPDSMKAMIAELETTWNAADKQTRANIAKAYKELGYKGFYKAGYTRADYERIHTTDEQIEKENHRDACAEVLNLWQRINRKTGKVKDWSGITLKGYCLNGFVTGEKGTVEVRSILAGGYNIQRLHVRTLVLG